MSPRPALPPMDNGGTRSRFPELAPCAGKSKIFNGCGDHCPTFVRRGGTGAPYSTLVNSRSDCCVVLESLNYGGTDVRENGLEGPQCGAGCTRDPGGAGRGMLLAAARPATGAGANLCPAAATASDAGCPRLTSGAVRLEDRSSTIDPRA